MRKYYISNNGNDANSGTSSDQAWKTIEKANTVTLEPGDSLLFESGGFWMGELEPKGSGAENARITIDQYGVGAKPVINGSGHEQAVQIYGMEYVTIQNLELMNDDSMPYLHLQPLCKRDVNDPANDPGIRAGNGALRLCCKESGHFVKQFIDLEKNTDYIFSAWVRSPEGEPELTTYLETGAGYIAENGSHAVIRNNAFVVSWEWSKVSVAFNTGNHESCTVYIKDHRGIKNSLIYIDDASLVKKGAPDVELLQDPGFESGGKFWANDSKYFAFVTRGVKDDPPIPPAVKPADRTPNILSGNESMHCAATGAGWLMTSPPFTVEPNVSYTIRFMAKGSGGVKVSGSDVLEIDSGEEWVQKSVDVKFGGDTGKVEFEDAVLAEGFYIDDVTVTKTGENTPFFTIGEYGAYENWKWVFWCPVWKINYIPEPYKISEQTRRGINIVAAGGKVHRGITIRDLDIHDVYGFSIRGMKWWSAAIHVTVDSQENNKSSDRFDDMLVENCYLHDLTCNGVYVNCGKNYNRNMIFRNIVTRNTGGDGLEIGHGDRAVVEYCAAYDVGCYPGTQASAIGGIFQWGNIGAITQFCEVGRIRPAGDSMAFDVELSTGTQLVQHCYVHDCGGAIVMWGGPYDAAVFRYNICQNVQANSGPYANICLGSPRNYFYNNVFYSDRTGPHDGISFENELYFTKEPGEADDTYFSNNIFVAAKPVRFPANIDYSNNLFCIPGTGPETVKDPHGIFAAPMFIEPGKSGNSIRIGYNANLNRIVEECAGYKLKDGSPAIGAGKVITTDDLLAMFPKADRRVLSMNDDIDFFGNKLPEDSRNIGAWENA